MVANVNSPNFSGGANIAVKCPYHTYEQTIAFYRDTLGLPLIEEEKEGCIFQFGPVRLWIDRVPNLSQPESGSSWRRTTPRAPPPISKATGWRGAMKWNSCGGFRRLLDFRSGRHHPPRRRDED
jgi:catechol 2,3-dioxygenase-like lactoylglutathione lyase family enzyme